VITIGSLFCVVVAHAYSHVARPHSAPRERVWDMVTERLVVQLCNTVMTSTVAIAKVGHATLLWDWMLRCDWYALHSAGNKLLYDHVPEPFRRCWMGSGHTRLAHANVLYVGLVNRFQGLDHWQLQRVRQVLLNNTGGMWYIARVSLSKLGTGTVYFN